MNNCLVVSIQPHSFHILSIGVYLAEINEICAVFPDASSGNSRLIAVIFLRPSAFPFPLLKQKVR